MPVALTVLEPVLLEVPMLLLVGKGDPLFSLFMVVLVGRLMKGSSGRALAERQLYEAQR